MEVLHRQVHGAFPRPHVRRQLIHRIQDLIRSGVRVQVRDTESLPGFILGVTRTV